MKNFWTAIALSIAVRGVVMQMPREAQAAAMSNTQALRCPDLRTNQNRGYARNHDSLLNS
jgi:hypothetical protein